MARQIPSKDWEVNQMGAYYSFATNFGFTPTQVDELDVVTGQAMGIIGEAMAKEQERAMRSGRRQ